MAGSALMAIFGLMVQGVYTETMLLRALIIAPIFMVGARLGDYFYKIFPAEWFKR